ncbi:MAG TPA: hypothetical protein DG942_00470 [Ruminococcaceae bacterium]|jgi:hypothetical protein|nr:hypothetical protein [Oscillospiraceae bacterium]
MLKCKNAFGRLIIKSFSAAFSENGREDSRKSQSITEICTRYFHLLLNVLTSLYGAGDPDPATETRDKRNFLEECTMDFLGFRPSYLKETRVNYWPDRRDRAVMHSSDARDGKVCRPDRYIKENTGYGFRHQL